MMSLPSASGVLISSFIVSLHTVQLMRSISGLISSFNLMFPLCSFPLRLQRGDPPTEFPDLLKDIVAYRPRREIAGSL